MAVELDGCGCGCGPGRPCKGGLSGCGCRFAGLSEGISYGRGTGPGYTHGVLSKPRFAPTLPPTRFTPNERVMVAESQDMFYGLDDLESTGKGLFWLVAAGGLAWWLLGRRI